MNLEKLPTPTSIGDSVEDVNLTAIIIVDFLPRE